MTSEPTCGGSWGWREGGQWEPRWMDQKVRVAAGETLTTGRCSSPSSGRGRQTAVPQSDWWRRRPCSFPSDFSAGVHQWDRGGSEGLCYLNQVYSSVGREGWLSCLFSLSTIKLRPQFWVTAEGGTERSKRFWLNKICHLPHLRDFSLHHRSPLS